MEDGCARRYAAESVDNIAAHAAEVLATSEGAGWTSLYAASLREPGNVESFRPLATPDQRISIVTDGTCEFESFEKGAWHGARYRPGQGALTAPRQTRHFRWRSRDRGTIDMLHLFIPPEYIEEAADELRPAGTAARRVAYDAVGFSDPVVASVGQSLLRGISRGYLDLYADSAARFLAAHLVSAAYRWPDYDATHVAGNELTDRCLERVLEYVADSYAEPIRLADLADVANVSRFHFTRLFKKRVGCTPHRYVVQTRMRAAATMLRDGEMSVTQVALACGYSSASHFAATFADAFGRSPAKYRLAASTAASGRVR